MVKRWWWLVVVLALCAGRPAFGQDEDTADNTAVAVPNLADPYADLDALGCGDLQSVFFGEVPRFVYDDLPDDLYELVLYVEDRCDLGEPMGRTRILASIWDGNFAEIIYGYGVMDWLVARWDPRRQPAPDSPAALFDTFTVDFANQLLPHQPDGSLEQFFCLFYSGRQDAAWDLLQGEDLDNTWLRYYYDEEIETLTHYDAPYIVSAYGGAWRPGGDSGFVDPKSLLGASVEQWTSWGYLRLAIEGRLGRAGSPYYVRQEGVAGYSDRWDALLFALEGGVPVWRSGPHLAEIFVGVGYDVVTPFKDQDVALASLNLSVGAGWRLHLDRDRRWYARLDGRYEWIGDRNGRATPLGGHALSARIGLGVALGRNPEPRLEALGYRGD